MKLRYIYYGWVIVIISIVILTAHALTIESFGVFLKPIAVEFNWDRGALSITYSIMILVTGVLALVAGRVTDRYGPRPIITIGGLSAGTAFLLMSQIDSLWQVYLIWGILIGVGFCFCILPIMAIIPRWFVKRRGMAMGFAMAGMGIGGIIAPLLSQWLISTVGWRQAFIIIGSITIIIITPLAKLLKHSPQRAGLIPYGEEDITEDRQLEDTNLRGLSLKQAVRTRGFWLFALILAGFFYCFGTVLVHIVPHATDIGVPPIIGASILSITAGVGIFSRFAIGFLSDRLGGTLALSICIGLGTLALIWLLFTREVWMFYLFAVLHGLSFGSIVTLISIVAAELFGLPSLGVIMGGIIFLATIGEATGAPVSGSIFDITGNYRLAFIICVSICATASILSLVLHKHKRKVGISSG